MERGHHKNKFNTTGEGDKPVGYTTSTAHEPSVANQIGGSGRTTRGSRGRGLNFQLLADVLERESEDPNGLNIAEAIVTALKGGDLDPKTKLLAQLELLQYIQPKLKAIEHKGKVELDSETADARLNYLLSKLGAPGGNKPGQPDGQREAGADRAVGSGRDEPQA